MKKIYQSSKKRAILSGILTMLVSISLAVLGDWNKTQDLFGLKVFFFFLFSICDIMHLALCAAQDSKENKLIAEMKKQMTAYENALTSIIKVSQSNASSLNLCIHDFQTNSKINEKLWNYKKACYQLCSIVYLAVCDLTNNKNCEISYVRLNEKKSGEISMFAYQNKAQQSPKLLNIKRNFLNKDNTQYFDMKMFDDSINETKVLYGSAMINNHFYRSPDERKEKPHKYNQFIGIPVFCDNSKMVGLLEITCFNDCSLGEDAEIVKDIADRYFVPYANLFLLLHKIEKALYLGINK